MRVGSLVLLLALTGCRAADKPAPAAVGQAVSVHAAPLPAVPRALPPVNAERLPASIEPSPTPAYHSLSAEECRTLACATSTTANQIERAAKSSPPHKLGKLDMDRLPVVGHGKRNAELRAEAGRLLALEARNRSAEAALELYYRLLEAELSVDLLTASLVELDALTSDADKLKAAGFADGAEARTLRTRGDTARAEQVRLQQGITRLNGELKGLLALDATPGRLLPADSVDVLPEPLDAAKLIPVALASRPELRLARLLLGQADAGADVLRPALAQLSTPQVPFDGDADKLRCELRERLAERERAVAREVTIGVDEYNSAREPVALARRRRQEADARLAELLVRERNGATVGPEVRLARVERSQAEADVVREAVRWKLADVKLRRQLGVLCCGG